MSTRSRYLALICLGAFLGVLLSVDPRSHALAQKIPLGRREHNGIWLVPLTRALSVPGELHLHQIRVAGVLSSRHESTALFLDEESYNHGIIENAVWLDLSSLDSKQRDELESASGRWARVTGKFDGEAAGNFALYSGGLTVSKITLIK